VVKNRDLLRIFGLKRDEVTECLKKLHNEELHNLFFSSGIIRMIKSRRMMGRSCSTNVGEEKCK
jgi:hypothetical protein